MIIVATGKVGNHFLSVSERHYVYAISWRHNFRYAYFVTTYLPFRQEWRAMCACIRLPYS